MKYDGIQFAPLYWIFHDNWKYYRRNLVYRSDGSPEFQVVENDHYGHMHFFLMGMDPFVGANQDAFTGSQRYTFSLVDDWGPRSRDVNQQLQYRVVGTPKWYFRVDELWRRVYVHPWDRKIPALGPHENRGIKFEASPRGKISGPFREGRDADSGQSFFPVFIKGARTLPLEHYLSPALSQSARDNHVAEIASELCIEWAQQKAQAIIDADEELGSSDFTTVFEEQLALIYDERTFDLQHNNYLFAGGNAPLSGDGPDPHPAARPPFGDALYIWPIIEYQMVRQLDWERLPGYEDSNDIDDEQFGDGWNIEVEIPFRHPTTQQYNSPFGSQPGVVSPPGVYHGQKTDGSPLVPEANRPKYNAFVYNDKPETLQFDDGEPREQLRQQHNSNHYNYDHPFKMPPGLMDQPVSFHDPYNDTSGKWVQQCLGGIVQARARVTIESKLGGRENVWVESTQYLPVTPFAGTDQAMGGS